MLTSKQFKKLVKRYIDPLISSDSSSLTNGICPEYVYKTQERGLALCLNKNTENSDIICLFRAQDFTEEDIRLTRLVMEEWNNCFSDNVEQEYFKVTAEQALLVAICKFVSPNTYYTLLNILNIFSAWAAETYEGQKISFSVGVNEGLAGDEEELLVNKYKSIFSVAGSDFIKVMASGTNTMIELSSKGSVNSYIRLPMPAEDKVENIFAPVSFLPIAIWASGEKYAVRLTSNGDILIFKDQMLLFAKRRGAWRFFVHHAYLRAMELKNSAESQNATCIKALYVSMLDASFHRRGACVAFWDTNCKHNKADDGKFPITIVSPNDVLDKGVVYAALEPIFATVKPIFRKVSFFNSIIKSKKFFELPRELRQELLSVDGATIILDDGTIYAVGAILEISAGSSGGGRTAAAKTLAKYGLGAKVSNDGKISLWKHICSKDGNIVSDTPMYTIG